MKKTAVQGRMKQYEEPNWEPLLYLLRAYVDDFMWMHEVELADGTSVHAYKHIETRRYLHLGEDHRAFVYTDDDSYREVESRRLVDLVMPLELWPCRE